MTIPSGKNNPGTIIYIRYCYWTVTPRIQAMLPPAKYTSRMGSAYVLPNDLLLQCSSKTGSVMVTDQQGKIPWELNSYFVPYRAEYVTPEVWDRYFTGD